MTAITEIQLANTTPLKGAATITTPQETETEIFDFKNNKENIDWDLNDGKISFIDKADSFLTGMGDKVKDQVGSLLEKAKENPLGAAACVAGGIAIGLLATACAPVGVALGAAGLVFGGKEIIETADDLKEASQQLKDSTSDQQTREILENMGGSTTELIEEGIGTAASFATVLSSIKGAIHTANAAKIHNDAWNMLEISGIGPDDIMPPSLAHQWDSMRLDQGVEILKAAGWNELLDKAVIAEEASLLLGFSDNN